MLGLCLECGETEGAETRRVHKASLATTEHTEEETADVFFRCSSTESKER